MDKFRDIQSYVQVTFIYITQKIWKKVLHDLLHHITYSLIVRKESLQC